MRKRSKLHTILLLAVCTAIYVVEIPFYTFGQLFSGDAFSFDRSNVSLASKNISRAFLIGFTLGLLLSPFPFVKPKGK